MCLGIAGILGQRQSVCGVLDCVRFAILSTLFIDKGATARVFRLRFIAVTDGDIFFILTLNIAIAAVITTLQIDWFVAVLAFAFFFDCSAELSP